MEAGRPQHREVDVDRGALIGVVIGVGMFVVVQAMITGAFQVGVISGDTPVFGPLKLSGFTQLIYVAPTLLFFVNRKCPGMAKGFVSVAALVFVGTIVALVLG